MSARFADAILTRVRVRSAAALVPSNSSGAVWERRNSRVLGKPCFVSSGRVEISPAREWYSP